jgi:hypothetical protein
MVLGDGGLPPEKGRGKYIFASWGSSPTGFTGKAHEASFNRSGMTIS